MGKRRQRATGTPLSEGAAPNDLWCADYKGEFKLGNRSWCYPLTVTDHASRYLLLCEALDSTREDLAFTAFERLFKRSAACHLRSALTTSYGYQDGIRRYRISIGRGRSLQNRL